MKKSRSIEESSPRAERLRTCAGATVEGAFVVARHVRGVVRRQLPGDLTLLDVRALAYVERQPSCGPSDVGAYLGLSAPATTKLLDPLVSGGMLSRATARDDRRRRVLAITARGRARLDAARCVTRAAAEARLATLADDELAAVERAMDVVQRLFSPATDDERSDS